MALLFDLAPLPPESRLTHVWHQRRVAQDRGGRAVCAHFVRLPADQSADVESDFLSSHLPFSLGGVAGVHPDGSPWLFALQQSAGQSGRPLSWNEELGVLDSAVQRALEFNPGAEVTLRVAWRRQQLVNDYEERGVDPEDLTLWSLADLAVGLLAECCRSSLPALAAGFLTGCAFPQQPHACEQDIFDDVFARWQRRLAQA